MQYHDVTTNSIWWTSAILQIVLSLYFSRRSADVDEIWSANANFGSKNGHVTKKSKFFKFKMVDGRHIENRFWLYLSDLLFD